MQDPKEVHWKYVKLIFRYLKGTTHFGINYCRSLHSLVDFTGFDWSSENDDQKSTYGFLFHYNIGPLVWL
jgi:hypothetical protein